MQIYPRMLLILCEGVTEKIYFATLIKYKRISGVKVEIFEKQGQHKGLIKKCVEKRQQYAKNFNIDETDIEAWAVYDKDSLKGGYQKLKRFADSKKVHLAFSDPQFETFLVQHFEYKKITDKGGQLERILADYIGCEYSKTDLWWLDKMIDEKPTTLVFAIKNARKLNNHTISPYLTVQELVARLLELAR